MRFTFMDWMNMNMVVDIAFLVFTIAFVWKLRKVMKYSENLSLQVANLKKDLEDKQKNIDTKFEDRTKNLLRVSKVQANDMFVLKTLIEKNEIRINQNQEANQELEKNLILTQKNPQAARRRLKEK